MDEMIYMTKRSIAEQFKRTGKCKQCGRCCKVYIMSGYSNQHDKYTTSFGFKKLKQGDRTILVLERPCANLTKDNKCKLHGKKSQPICCVQFPIPNDQVYIYVKKHCGYKFPPPEKKTVTMSPSR